ncbi:MAG: MFS transporter [Candidatus Nealsonbacteria bacterium]|nr:MFS transporter [Candidatus Nealsonbacteria bacterium]
MAIFPKIERITRDATMSHFLLMFGYKLYSFYFPLFLVAKSFSIAQIGYANFLIYLPIALFSPLAGFLNHKFNPAILSAIGIFGYGIHALGMIVFPNIFSFYLFQIILGISAALFFVSSRAILMGSKIENYDRSFAWFYSANSYAAALSPAIGALVIWKFGFAGVFLFSFILQVFNSIFCFGRLRKQTRELADGIKLTKTRQNYESVWSEIRGKGGLGFLLISFLVLILLGFNNTFFVLFLKNLGWSLNQILIFNSLLSAVFLPISFWVIKQVGKAKSETNISRGSQFSGVFSFLLGALGGVLNFYLAFFIMLGSHVWGLVADAGRSGLLSVKLKKYPEESAALDTVFSPLATAFGSFFGGLIIPWLGYPMIFMLFGALLFGTGFIGRKFAKSAQIR